MKYHTHTTLCTAHPALDTNPYSGSPTPATAAVMTSDVHPAHIDDPEPDHVPDGQLVHAVEPREEKVPLMQATHVVRLKTKAPARQINGQPILVPRPINWVYTP
jgi:hypothetical protein